MSHRLRTGTSAPCRAASVGYRKYWWGQNPSVARAVEWALSQYETPASDVLDQLPAQWPIDGERRASLAAFIAIHSVRTPGFRAQADQIAEETIRERREASRHVEARFDRVADKWRSNEWRWPDAMGRQIPRVASMLACMQWLLIAFDEPLLIASDQPVVAVPVLRPGERREISVFPRGGYLNTMEFRFALDPHHSLLLSWADGKDPPEPVAGDLDISCDHNRSVRAQADQEWFWTPNRLPMFVRPPFVDDGLCSPISSRLIHGYDRRAVEGSERRRRADAIARDFVSDKSTGQRDIIRWVYAA
jgi:hypothetical protein